MGFFFLKSFRITDDFIEVVVNKITNQTAFIGKDSGKLMYWPEFLLGVNSVEFLNARNQQVFVKPLDHAGTINQSYSFMKPLKVKQNWMHVQLLDDSFKVIGKGWIKWNIDGKLLINYSLLS